MNHQSSTELVNKLHNYFGNNQSIAGNVQRALRSENASSSMPEFMTPSTMDSRQKIMSRLSAEYPLDSNKNSVSRLSGEIQNLMRRKIQLMEEIYEFEKQKPMRQSAEIFPITNSVSNIHSNTQIKHNLSTQDDLNSSTNVTTDKLGNEKSKFGSSNIRVSTVGKHSNRKKLNSSEFRQNSAQFVSRKNAKSTQGYVEKTKNMGILNSSNGNISENEFKVVNTNFKNRLSNEELFELLENMKYQRDFYKSKYENLSKDVGKSSEHHSGLNPQKSGKLNPNSRSEISSPDGTPRLAEPLEHIVENQDDTTRTKEDPQSLGQKIDTQKVIKSKSFNEVRKFDQLFNIGKPKYLRMKKGLAITTGVKSEIASEVGEVSNKFMIKYNQVLEANKKLISEKDRLIKELRNKEKFIQSIEGKHLGMIFVLIIFDIL